TEAGIVYEDGDLFTDAPPKTYPAKLTKLLYERFCHFRGAKEKGLIVIPCELIEDNGGTLKACVKQYAARWELGDAFEAWLEEACCFCSTLVDRIVTGYPKEEVERLWDEFGYEDRLLDTGELFALWVIESAWDISEELPLKKAGLPVVFTDNQKPYRERKVRILNGAHTSFVLASYLAGNDFVGQSMQDETVRKFMTDTVFEEIIPTLSLPEEDCKQFAKAVIERFENPFIRHALLDISLNSVAKWKARCKASLTGYLERFGTLPKHLVFSLAALLCFYSATKEEDGALVGQRGEDTYRIRDNAEVLEFFRTHCTLPAEEFVRGFLTNEAFFGEDMTKYAGLEKAVCGYVMLIRECGMRKALEQINA
ncbi:MAG: tagaturonate reductase, partial [Lachnospiraceae bacterium]